MAKRGKGQYRFYCLPINNPKAILFFQNPLRKGYFLKDTTFRVNVSSEKQSH